MKLARSFIIAAGLALLSAFAPSSVSQVAAEDLAPIIEQAEFSEISTPHYAAYEADFEPPLGKYTYEVSWNGIPAAESTITVGSDDFRYHVVAEARTYSPINLFYDLHFRADSLISALDLSPQKIFIRQQENSKVKLIDVNFHPDGSVESVRSQEGKPTRILRFNSGNPTLDPFAATFLARGLDWKVGDSKYFDTFNGKVRYLITLTADGKEDCTVNEVVKTCWVISPQVRKLNSKDEQHKLRKARIYVTDDKAREVVKIVSEVFVGSVTTKLIGYEPAETPAPIRMAQLRARPIIK